MKKGGASNRIVFWGAQPVQIWQILQKTIFRISAGTSAEKPVLVSVGMRRGDHRMVSVARS